MKSELERVDFGGHPKYNGGSTFGNVLFPGRSEKFNTTKKAQTSSLFDLNPHRFGLGLRLEDYTASKLCPRPSLAELHSDAAAEPLPPAAASTGAVLERSVSPDAAALQLSKQQQQQEEQGGSAAAPASEPEAHGRRKRQRLSQTPQAPAAAAAAADDTRQLEQPPSLETLASLSADEEGSGSPSGDSGFVFIDSSSSSEDEEGGGGDDHDGSQGSDSGSDSDSDAAEDAADPSNAVRAAGNQGAGEGEGVEQQTSSRAKKQRQKQQQGREDRHERGGAAAAAAAGGDGQVEEEDELMLSSSEESEGSDGGDDDGHTVTLSGDEDEDSEEFVPLLDLPPGPGTDDPQDPHATLQQQQQQRAVSGYQPPWLPRLAYFSSPLMRLHNEIVAFCQMLAPTAEEIASRAASLDSLRDVVRSIWPAAGVKVFGSYETGLYTPASDTDVVVVDSGMQNAQTGLKALAQALEARHLVRNMQLVLSARVPIIKFEMIDSGLAFDVSWEVPSGPQGAQVVKQLLEEWPALKPLALVLKVFLTQRELNEVYTGGVGSYTLIIMIVSFLQLHQSRRPANTQQHSSSSSSSHKRRRSGGSNGSNQAQELDSNLGLLLVDFMRLYGRVLNLNQVGISCTQQGAFFQRSLRGFSHINRKRGAFVPPGQMSLSVQDPIDPTNDTARGSFNMKLVRQVFDHAYQLLNAPCPSNMSLLGRIIHLAPVVSGRPVPPWCVEAPSRGQQQQQNDRRSSRHDRHHRSSRDSRSRSPSRHKHSHSSRGREKDSRERSRDRGREKGHRQKGSRSRSRSESRGGKHSSGKQHKHEHHHHHSKQHKSSSSKERHRRHSSDSGSKQRKKDKGRSSSEHKGSGRQQKIDKWVQPSPDSSSRGGQGSRGLGSRQSFGSDSGREYGHRDKRRRY